MRANVPRASGGLRSLRCLAAHAALAGALAAALPSTPGCGGATGPAPDALLLTIDTLRGDRWGCMGDPGARTPHLDRLARGGALACEGRSPVPITLPSHASMMTGLPPAVHGVRDNAIFRLSPTEGRTLAEVFRDEGYATAAYVSAFPLYPRFGLDRGFDHYDCNLGSSEGSADEMRQRPAREAVDRLAAWLARGPVAPERPFFLWMHFFDPHAEYEAPPPWPSLFPDAPYDAEVAFADAQAGRLLAELDRARPGRPRRIVVASDHGEGLYEHGESSHGALLHATTIRVPIVARGEGYRPRLLAEPRELERVPATLLSLCGLDPEVNDASAPPLEDPATAVYAETLYAFFNFGWAGLRVCEEDGWRLIAGPVDRLYRMTDDPGERRDVAAQHPDVVARMRDALEQEWDERRAIAYAPESRDVTEAESEVLQSLGYVGGGAPADADEIERAFEATEDPAARLEWIDRINMGLTLFREGRVDEAVAVLGAVVREDPGNRFVLQHLGAALLQADRPAEARRALKDALSRGPNPDRVYIDLARAERALENPEGEKATLMDALAAHPESAEVRLRLSRPLVEEGQLEAAATLIREALEIRPRSVTAHLHLAQVYQMQGKLDEARTHWERVIELDDGGIPTRQARRALQILGQPGR